MGATIDRPTLGRTIHFTDREGKRFAGTIADDFTSTAISLNYFDRGALRFEESVPYSGDGNVFSWRYPARSEDNLTVG